MENRRRNNNIRSQNKKLPCGTYICLWDVSKSSEPSHFPPLKDVIGSTSFPVNPHIKHGQLDNFLQVPPIPQYCLHFPNHVQCSCILEFDGASKGNHGQAGAGAVLRASNGNMNVHMEFLEGGCPLWLTNNKKG